MDEPAEVAAVTSVLPRVVGEMPVLQKLELGETIAVCRQKEVGSNNRCFGLAEEVSLIDRSAPFGSSSYIAVPECPEARMNPFFHLQ